MPLKMLPKKEVEEITKKLENQFGIKEIPGKLFRQGAEKVFLFQGEIEESEIKLLESAAPIERIGVYLLRVFEPTGELRLSIEGTQILKNQITKNFFEINSEQAKTWMEGQELNVKSNLKGIIAIKYKEDFLGCGKASEEKIGNFIPKNRRLKIKTQ